MIRLALFFIFLCLPPALPVAASRMCQKRMPQTNFGHTAGGRVVFLPWGTDVIIIHAPGDESEKGKGGGGTQLSDWSRRLATKLPLETIC